MMAGDATRGQVMLARFVVGAVAVLLALGLIRYGFSAEVHQRIWRDIAARPGGPMTIRFLLQPAMAAVAAFHDGTQDARLGRSPYLWTILSNRRQSAGRLREGLIATARILLMGLVMDGIYQATVLKTFYPGEMLIVALLLAFLPYVLLRGAFARLAGWQERQKKSGPGGGTRR